MTPTAGSRLDSPSEAARRRLLVTTRRRATGLLAAVAAVFAGTVAAGGPGWLQATALAAMVGGLADWFAVTALFRRPLGLPIPHTAIVVERKDRFAETLGSFVQESFLTPDAVIARLRGAEAVPRLAAWLRSADNAATVAARLASALAGATDLLADAEATDIVGAAVRRRLDGVAVAPLAGRLLQRLTTEGRHEPIIDAALQGLARWISVNGTEMHRRLGVRSPWWVPGRISTRLVAQMLIRAESAVADMAADRHHPLRRQLEDGLVELAGRLQHDPLMRERGEQLKAELLDQPTVRRLAASVWAEAKSDLHRQAGEPDSELQVRLTAALVHAGERLDTDPQLAAAAQRSAEAAVRVALDAFAPELVGLVSGTIARWDAAETAGRLELLLGPDLQWVRINGTVVGGLAGLILHLVAAAAG